MSTEDQAATAEQQPPAAAAVAMPPPPASVDDAGDALRAVAISDDSAAEQAPAANDSSKLAPESAPLPAADELMPTHTSEGVAAAAPAPADELVDDAAPVSTSDGSQQADRPNNSSSGPAAADVAAQPGAAAAAAATDTAPVNGASPAEPAKSAPYAFTGMQCVLDKAAAPVNALAFGRLDSALLAFGADDGVVRVASISEQKASILHEMREHKKRVTDLDWSLENHQLLTSAADGSVCLSSNDDGIWSMARRFQTSTPAMACLFHPVNQNLIIVGTASGTVEVFNSSTGLQLEDCRATLTSSQAEGVSVVAMDASRDALFVGDSAGYVHVLRLALAKGALLPLTQIERIPPAGNRLASFASIHYTAYAASVKGAALLTAGVDDLVCVYRIHSDKGSKVRLELASKHLMPQSARPIRAAWCPTLPSGEPEYVAMGSEDSSVYVYDVSDSGTAPLPVVRLQGHCAPTVAVAWAFDERRLASSDCDGTVIVWKREHAVADTNDDPY